MRLAAAFAATSSRLGSTATGGFDAERVVAYYVRTALWSETDESNDAGGEPLDRNYGPGDLTAKAWARIRRDVNVFLAHVRAAGLTREAVAAALQRRGNVEDQLGHDFWLTRNGHGAGFWDGDWSEPVASQLDAIATRMGEVSLYVSRRKIHHYPA